MKLQDKAVLVNFTGRCWSARKYDKKVTRKVENIYDTSNAGRWNKVLIQLDKLKEITGLISEFRRYHYFVTVPWENNCALLPSDNIIGYSNKARDFKEKFNNLKTEFIADFPQLKENAEASLNEMFRESDYPTLRNLEDKFEFTTSLQPIGNVDDIRVNLHEEELVRIKEEYAILEQEALANGMKKVWDRTYEAVKHIVEKVSTYSPESKGQSNFRDTLISNVTDLVQILPALNIINDPNLEKMRRELEQKICTIQPHNLRNDAQLRDDTVEVAKDLLNRMSGFTS